MANRNVLINENTIIAMADALRNKNNTSQTYTVAEMAAAIEENNSTPAISVTDTLDSHGGIVKTITSIDISDTTVKAADVVRGKIFYSAWGEKMEGIAAPSTVQQWIRPVEWPDLSSMDISGQVLYLTFAADEARGFIDLKMRPATTVEIGTISNGTFTAEQTYSVADNTNCRHYFGSAQGGYKVVRITSANNIYYFDHITGNDVYLYDNEYRYSTSSGLLEVYGNLPYATTFSMDNAYWLESCIVKNIQPTNASSMFRYDYNLQNIDCSTWNFSNCTKFEYTFDSCWRLESITMDKWCTSACTSLLSMFGTCYNLKEVNILNWDTSNVTNFSNMFTNNNKLIHLTLPNGFIKSNATAVNSMFSGCYYLESINLSGSNCEKVTNFSSMFQSCKNLKNLILPNNFVKSAATNISSMFNDCKFLKSINVSQWDVSNVTNTSSFMQNANYAELPVGISSWNMGKVTNTQNMFNSNSIIESITLPASLSVISASTFANFRACSEFHFLRETPPTLANTNAFANMTNFDGKKIYVPYSADHSILNAYKTASNWSTYASYIYEEAV